MCAATLTSARQDVFKLQACSLLLTLISSSFQALLFVFFCSSLIFPVLLSGGAFQSVFAAAGLDTVDPGLQGAVGAAVCVSVGLVYSLWACACV